ncbi:MAG: FtsX-like permease family protein [Bacteroidales bacterium]|nr:FtsX-like permease family protein [Bacteroidales bacterium]
MKSEKWAIFLILVFILAIASFNVIGSLTMLILEKKKDISILLSMGAGMQLIKRIFNIEGWLISVIGTVTGLVLGLVICFIQIKYEVIKLQGSGSFVIDAYPVDVNASDLILFTCCCCNWLFCSLVPDQVCHQKTYCR